MNNITESKVEEGSGHSITISFLPGSSCKQTDEGTLFQGRVGDRPILS